MEQIIQTYTEYMQPDQISQFSGVSYYSASTTDIKSCHQIHNKTKYLIQEYHTYQEMLKILSKQTC